MKIIHLSDTHLIDDSLPSLYGVDPKFRLEKAFESISKHHKDAKFTIISGDISNNGSIESYRILKQTAEKFSLKLYPLIGNHDIRENFKYYFQNYINEGFVQYHTRIKDRLFLFLDSVVEGKAYGYFCEERLKWLKNTLTSHKECQIFIFMHHHPVDCGLYEMDHTGYLKNRDDFWNIIKRYRVKHISFGHIHRIMHSVKYGITMHSTRSTVFQVAYAPRTKKELLINDEQPTYAIINIDDNGDTTIHHHEYLNEDRVYVGVC